MLNQLLLPASRKFRHSFNCLLILLLPHLLSADVIQHNGITYRNLSEVSTKLRAETRQLNEGNTWELSNKRNKLTFRSGSRAIHLNDTPVYLGYPIIKSKKSLYIPELDWRFTLSPILHASKRTRQIKRIVLDPGHGGKDPGAINESAKLYEKDLTLAVCKKLKPILKKQGFEVFLTRSNDKYLTLEERTQYARSKRADLFISIHFNASTNTNAEGIETFAYTLLSQPSTSRSIADQNDRRFHPANRYDSQNTRLAYFIHKSLARSFDTPNRGIKRARFTVLETLACPGALLELGFLSHPESAAKLSKNKEILKLVDAIVEGIQTYSKETRV